MIIDVNNIEIKSILTQFQSFVKIETLSFLEKELKINNVLSVLNNEVLKIRVFSDCINNIEYVGEKIVLPSYYTMDDESQKNLIFIFEFIINKIKDVSSYDESNGILVDVNKDNINILHNSFSFEKETILLYNLLTIQLCEKLKK